MEEEVNEAASSEEEKPEKKHIPEVYTLRDWKEYMGESFLIIFSVILALVLTEFFNNLHEKNETKELLANVRNELITNKKLEKEQYTYHLTVLKIIDSALSHPEFQKRILTDDGFHLKYLVPHGLLYHDLDNIAWEVAKNHNILAKVNFKTMGLLTRIYNDQSRIMKVEDEVAKVVLSRESRNPQNIHLTLTLIRDNFEGWAVDSAPGLIERYDAAIKLLAEGE